MWDLTQKLLLSTLKVGTSKDDERPETDSYDKYDNNLI